VCSTSRLQSQGQQGRLSPTPNSHDATSSSPPSPLSRPPGSRDQLPLLLPSPVKLVGFVSTSGTTSGKKWGGPVHPSLSYGDAAVQNRRRWCSACNSAGRINSVNPSRVRLGYVCGVPGFASATTFGGYIPSRYIYPCHSARPSLRG